VVLTLDEKTGKAEQIERLQLAYDGSVSVREYFGLPPREEDPEYIARQEHSSTSDADV
jgi:hypothetical protein